MTPHYLFIIFFALLSFWVPVHATESPEITAVIRAASTQEEMQIVNAIDKIIPAFEPSNLVFLTDLWDINKSKYPKLPWKRFETDVVRVEIANVLLQAARNGRQVTNKESLHDFVRKRAGSPNPVVRGMAASALGMAGDDRDIPLLSKIVSNEEPGVFEQAALGLVAIDSGRARDALHKLERTVSRQDAKAFLRQINNPAPIRKTDGDGK